MGKNKSITAGARTQCDAGHIQLGDRNFYVVGSGAGSQLAAALGYACGPWAVVENNGDGKGPRLIRGGITGNKQNAARVLVREVTAISAGNEQLGGMSHPAFGNIRLPLGERRTNPPQSREDKLRAALESYVALHGMSVLAKEALEAE